MLEAHVSSELRANPEFQSAVVRLGIWLFSVLYIGLGWLTGYYAVDSGYYFTLFGGFLVAFLAIAASVVMRPVWPGRHYVGLVADICGVSLAIFLTQEAISPFYLLYIWLFISYGTRYGLTPLKVASLLSVLAYVSVLFALQEWQKHTFEAIFFLLLLVILPIYQHSLLRKVHEARREAERATQAKSDFLATMTHELRTPLSGVIGMTRLLESTPLGDQQRDYVHSIAGSAQMLRALIGDILDLSKIEARKLHLECREFDLHAAVLEVLAACEGQALDKRLDLLCLLDPHLPVRVMGDEIRLRQILFNLVGNAVKFTRLGEIAVRVKALEHDSALERPHICIEVRDTGIGIAKQKLLHIFDSFWQADDSTSRRFGGTGLGTTIARDLTCLMGGTIDVQSEEGKGSLFRVRLPLPAAPGAATAPPITTELRGLKALMFEENDSAREHIGASCQSLGMDWQGVARPRQLDALSREHLAVDLAVLADSPAGVDLEALGRRLRDLAGRPVPLVFLTYTGRRQPRDGECPHCLNKLHSLEQLRNALLRRLAVPRRDSDAGARLHSVQLPAAEDGGLNVLVAEDNAIAAKVILVFLNNLGHRVTLTRDGEETLARACAERFDIAFVDLRMPRLDGMQFTRGYRQREEPGRHLPIITLSANAEEEIRREALAAGMDDFLSKPVEPQALASMIRLYVNR